MASLVCQDDRGEADRRVLQANGARQAFQAIWVLQAQLVPKDREEKEVNLVIS